MAEAEAKPRKRGRIVVGVIVLLIVACGIGSFILDRVILAQTYARVPASSTSLLATYDDFAADYPRKAVEFEMNGYTLRGYVYCPDNDRGLVIFRHGIYSQHEDYLALITALADRGWRVFAYDAIGCGQSDGDSVLGFSQSPLDVAAAIDYARESGMADGLKIALWGHSWGGYGVAAALSLRDVDACVTMSGFNEPLEMLDYGAQATMGPVAITQRPTVWLNTVLAFGRNASINAAKAVESSGIPTLVIHGSDDAVVPQAGVSVMDGVLEDGVVAENVEMATYDEPGRNGHNTYFYDRASQEYFNQCTDQLNEVLDANGDDPNDPAVQALLDGVDRRRANTANPELIDQVDSFLGASLGA